MSDQTYSSDEWQPCPSGQITGMVQRLQAARRSRAVRRAIVPAAGVLLFAAAGFYFSQSQPGGMFFQPGGLSCDEVQRHLPAYAKGKVSPELSRQLEEHLADCPECRKMHEKMGGRVAVPSLHARAGRGEGYGRLGLVAKR